MTWTKTRIKTLITLSFIAFFSLSSIAQASLPYYSGFDDEAQQTGWNEYKKAATTFSHWGYGGTGNSFSAPSSIGHDYSPSSGITLTDNWYVSPGFSIDDGGILDSIRYRFSGFSVPEVGDTVALYLLTGSQDPDLATSKLLLFDFRGEEYSPDNTYRIKTGINLLATMDLAYLAIRYRNTDCSSKWLTVGFDNIAISGNTSVGINNLNANSDQIKIYPNPASGMFYIETEHIINSINIYNANGEIIYNKLILQPHDRISISDYKAGIYFMNYTIGKKTYNKKIVIF